MNEALREFAAERDRLFADPTEAGAARWWARAGNPPPVSADVPLAAVHKARLQWLEATDRQLAESRAWLEARGYETSMQGWPALTPERRDADRAAVGKPPLGSR